MPRLARLLAAHPNPPAGVAAWLKKLVEATGALVNQHHEDLATDATELHKKGTLTGQGVEEALTRPRSRFAR